MITSIFSKSKPTNLVIGFLIIAFACLCAFLKGHNSVATNNNVPFVLLCFALCFFSLLLINFITGKNNLSQTTTLEVPLYSSFFVLVPETTLHLNSIIATVLILLGLRRIISLRSNVKVKNKLFDASLCITLASLFYAWSILFFLVLLLAVYLHPENKIRHWLIVLVGSLTVYSIIYSVSFVADHDFFEHMFNGFKIGFNFGAYGTPKYIIVLILTMCFGLWASWFYFAGIGQRKKLVRPAYYVTLAVLFIAIIINSIDFKKNGSAFVFMFAPLSIIIANYIETIVRVWLKESIMAIFLFVPFIIVLL